jgi:predicted phage terminase large subunit-like protein
MMIIKKTINKYDLRASILRDSFVDFVRFFWDTICPEKMVENWHIPYLCGELQTMAEKVFRGEPRDEDMIINISPGTSKSTICSIMFPAWVWTRMPSARLICGSYAYMLALELSRKTRMLVESELHRAYFPEVELMDDQNTKEYFVTKQGGGRRAVGTGGSITGFHAHFILVDDPIDPQGALSEADLKAANLWMRETLPTRKVDKALTPTVLIMQRLHQNDCTGDWLSRQRVGVKHICLPAELSDNVKPESTREKYVDGLMDPVRLPRHILRENEVTLGQYGYSGQFGQRPTPRGGGMFRASRIEIDTPPRTFVSRVRYWDKAGTKDGGAYTAGVLMGKDLEGQWWVTDVKRGQWDSAEREKIIRQTAEIDGIGVIVGVEQEPGSGGKESAENTVRRLAGFRVRVDRPTGDKVLRADPFSVQVNMGNVKIVRGEWNHAFLEELEHFPNSTYKDQTDACSGAFALQAKVRRRIGGL